MCNVGTSKNTGKHIRQKHWELVCVKMETQTQKKIYTQARSPVQKNT